MKVYIGPYKYWIGPYQIAEALCFWAPKVTDEHGFKSKPDWVHDFGTWLGENKDGSDSWLTKLCLWIESKRERTVKIRIDKYDTWNMESTLALIVLPMLKQSKETKHGSPNTDDEDVPEHLRSINSKKENEYDTDENHFARWDWILNEMIWAFEQNVDHNSEDQFFDHSAVDEKAGISEQIGKIKIDHAGLDAHSERKANGFRLFGKYYSGLWD